MKTVGVALLAVGVFLAGAMVSSADDKDDRVKKEMAKLEGRWQKTKQQANGKDTGDVTKAEMSVVGNKMIFFYDGNENTRGEITIDPSTDPMSINIKITAGIAGTQYGIYRWTDDGQLEICVTQPSNKPDE